MGIEPTSEAWEANIKNLKALELAALSVSGPGFNWKTNGNEKQGQQGQLRFEFQDFEIYRPGWDSNPPGQH